jgi:hypothetical protein
VYIDIAMQILHFNVILSNISFLRCRCIHNWLKLIIDSQPCSADGHIKVRKRRLAIGSNSPRTQRKRTLRQCARLIQVQPQPQE